MPEGDQTQMNSRRSLIQFSAATAGALGARALLPDHSRAQATPIAACGPDDPYAKLPPAPSFTITSTDFNDGDEMPESMRGDGNGQNRSPQLSWSGYPAETKSFAVTMFDADAPTPSGFWHWAVIDIPAASPELPAGAGSEDGAALPSPAVQMPNDTRAKSYRGAAPPSGTHRYFIAVHALDVDALEIDSEATPALLSFTMLGHTLARAVVVALATT
jgi:Raf kinase inhibitor-like YbhB/YbcL family protein